jgi:CheY-like chemotaxis protein
MAGEKILIVDDSELVRTAFEDKLGEAGYQVVRASTGEEALEAVRKEKFDLAYVDLVMPGMDGVETCKAIVEVSPKTKVVLISCYSEKVEELGEKFIGAGGEDMFLLKPFSKEKLVETTKELLKEKA